MTKVWVLSTCIPEECQPDLPRVFATETAALQAFREEMATEWQYNGAYGEDGELLPCPENPYEANEVMTNAGRSDGWGAWELLPIEIEDSEEEAVDWVALAEADGATLFDDREAGSPHPAWRWRGNREDDCADSYTREQAAEMYCATNGVGP